ncbi:MAG TPA: response regulator [Anaerolineae bacterium]|nr:response regulator [Anaerolineae bacterium]
MQPKETPHILVIDDEANIRRFLQKLLEKEGYQVTTVDSGESFLPHIAEQEYDLAFVDLQMKQVSGLEVIKALHEHWPQTVVIILTGHGTLETAVTALDYNAHNYLFKPCDINTLRQSVAAGLKKRYKTQTPPTNISTTTIYNNILHLNHSENQLIYKHQHLQLTANDYKLLLYLLENKNRIVPLTELVNNVEGFKINIDGSISNTRRRLTRLITKLSQIDLPNLIQLHPDQEAYSLILPNSK